MKFKYRFVVIIFFLFFFFSLIFIFDYRQSELDSNDNDYNYGLDVEIPNKAILPNKDIFNNFKLYNNDHYENGSAYKFLRDSKLLTRLKGNSNNSYICELTFNNEIGNLLGCYVIWNTIKSNNSKTLRITILKENTSIIIFQEITKYKELSNKFSESYIILNNTKIVQERIFLETFSENHKEIIQVYEIYLLIISNNDLYPEVYYEQYNLIFIFDYEFYKDYKTLLKFCFYIFCCIYYILFYFFQIKKNKLLR